MASIFQIEEKVAFAQTDAAGVMHFSEFTKLMEKCEHAFLESLGLPVLSELLWPRRACSCEFYKPLRFGDMFQVAIDSVTIGKQSLQYTFVFTADAVLAEGKLAVVCCRRDGDDLCAAPIPDHWRDRIEAAVNVP